MLIDKALSSDKPNGHWFEADWLHCKRDALSSNRKVDGSRLTGNTQAQWRIQGGAGGLGPPPPLEMLKV